MRHIVLVGNTAWSMYNFRSGLIRALIEDGYKVTVLAPKDEHYYKLIEEIGSNFINVNIESKGTNPIKDIQLYRELKKIYTLIKPDFIFTYTIKPNIYGSFAARALNIKHIAITTGLGYTFIKKNCIAWVARRLYWIALRSPRQVWFLNSDDYQNFLQYKLIRPNKGYIINGEGVNLEKFPKTDNQTPEISFLLIARILWDKGIGEFVEAARKLKLKYPNTKFQLLGFLGVDNPSAIPKEQIDKWEQEGVINYLGSTENVLPFINNTSCVVLPSYREGIPISLLEASAMCKPIIATDAPGCRNTVEDGVTGYLCKVRDWESLAQAMEKMIILSPSKRQQMGEAGREKVKQQFDETTIIKIYLNVLKEYLY